MPIQCWAFQRREFEGDLCSFLTRKGSRTETEIKRKVKDFFLRDDVSHITTSRKQTIPRLKNKMQKRLLTDTMTNMHRKFLSEEQSQLSYTSFCHLRPFRVVTPNNTDSKTCQCKTHENLQFMVNSLHSLGLLSTKNLEDMVKSSMCDPKSKLCAYGECKDCFLTSHPTLKPPANVEVPLTQWTLEKIQKDVEKCSMITVKREVTITETELSVSR